MFGLSYLAVVGQSMAPTLRDGDWVLARRPRGPVAPGEVVVVEDPRRPGFLLVKRLARVGPQGFWVLGDRPEASTDSRHFGPVGQVRGQVIWRISPWGPVR